MIGPPYSEEGWWEMCRGVCGQYRLSPLSKINMWWYNNYIIKSLQFKYNYNSLKNTVFFLTKLDVLLETSSFPHPPTHTQSRKPKLRKFLITAWKTCEELDWRDQCCWCNIVFFQGQPDEHLQSALPQYTDVTIQLYSYVFFLCQ